MGCLHQQANDFLHQCINMMQSAKGTSGFSLVVLCVFYRQKVSGALQRAYAISILRCPRFWRWKLFLGLLLFWVCSPPFQICFLHLPGGSRTYLFLCPPLWLTLSFALLVRTWVLSLSSSFSPFVGCFV